MRLSHKVLLAFWHQKIAVGMLYHLYTCPSFTLEVQTIAARKKTPAAVKAEEPDEERHKAFPTRKLLCYAEQSNLKLLSH